MKHLLEVKNLHISFSTLSRKVAAVRGVSFHLSPGEIVGIVGESGCGKSALARTITRLLPPISSNIDQGQVLYREEDLLLKSEQELCKIRGKEIGMIFQDPMTSLNPTMPIGNQITEGYRLHYPKIAKKERNKRALSLLKKLGISEADSRLKQYPHELSGGMRQRIMIAIAMISSPSLLIADEPTTSLDVTIQAEILELLKQIQQKEKISIILITHDLSIVSSFCDRVLVMYAGEIVESAPTTILFKNPRHPYTCSLLRSIPRLDLPPTKPLYSIEGSPPDLSIKIKGCAFAKRCPDAMSSCHHKKPQNQMISQNQSVTCFFFDPQIQEKERKK